MLLEFTKLLIQGKPSHDISCFCICHNHRAANCEVQLFKLTTDANEALDDLYYREDFTQWSDDEEFVLYDASNNENRITPENGLNLKL